MDKQRCISAAAETEEDRLLLARIYDKLTHGAERDFFACTGFLSPREQAMTRRMLPSLPLVFFGGCDGAERRMACYLPEYLDASALTEEDSPLVCLRATFYQGDSPSHRDFLGALIGAGISRENIGDICVGKGFCDFFVTASVAPFLLQSFTGAGRTHLHLEQVPLTQVQVPDPEVKEIRDTLASLRLDSVISAGFRIGRSLASTYVTAGKAFIDGLPCEKPDKPVSEGCKISVRGLGKIKLAKINGTTKKTASVWSFINMCNKMYTT